MATPSATDSRRRKPWIRVHLLFAEAVRLGAFTAEQAAAVRAEGERVIAARPWPTGWETWRPPTDWTPLALPSDWETG